MPSIEFPAAPATMLNLVMGTFPDRTIPVRSNDIVSAILPMYNEGAVAKESLESLLSQTKMPKSIIVSVNGGGTDNDFDKTYYVVRDELQSHGYISKEEGLSSTLDSGVETWVHEYLPEVKVIDHIMQTSKADSVNGAIRQETEGIDRILILDGDTILKEDFLEKMSSNFYRLNIKRTDKGPVFEIEDYGLQSASVQSLRENDKWQAKLISSARKFEYAFATVVRKGQATVFGNSKLFGNTRLFTATGCGLTARKELYPMPQETLTEDHDFSLKVQDDDKTKRESSRDEIERMGLEFYVNGEWRKARDIMDAQDRVVITKSGNARFVDNAIMYTHDPPSIEGLIRQWERWNGGAIQVMLNSFGNKKRKANTAYATGSANLENIIISGAMAAAIAGIAMHAANPDIGLSMHNLEVGLGIDTSIVAGVAGYGFYLASRAQGYTNAKSALSAIKNTAVNLLPFELTRFIGPVTYLKAMASELYTRAKNKLSGREKNENVIWERPNSGGSLRKKAAGYAPLAAAITAIAFGAYGVSGAGNDYNLEAMNLMRSAPSENAVYNQKPVWLDNAVNVTINPKVQLKRVNDNGISQYCAAPSDAPLISIASLGNSDDYKPLTFGQLQVLARMAPVAGYLENAATYYNYSKDEMDMLLKTVLFESWYNPLAEGKTNDKGLGQITPSAINLVRNISLNYKGQEYNPRLAASDFSVWNPDWNLCATASKLAYVSGMVKDGNEGDIYALYVNPAKGIVNGVMPPDIESRVNDFEKVTPNFMPAIENAFAAYDKNPKILTSPERRLILLSKEVTSGNISPQNAYLKSSSLSQMAGVDDSSFYEKVQAKLYAAKDLVLGK